MDKKKWAIIGLFGFIILAVVFVIIIFTQSGDNVKQKDTNSNVDGAAIQPSDDKKKEPSKEDIKKEETKNSEKPKKETKDKKDEGALSSEPKGNKGDDDNEKKDKSDDKKEVKQLDQTKADLEKDAKTFLHYTTMPQIQSKSDLIYNKLEGITSDAFKESYFNSSNKLKHPIKNTIGPFNYETYNYNYKWLTKDVNKNTKNAEVVVSFTTKLQSSDKQPKEDRTFQLRDQKLYVKFVREHGKLVVDQTRM